MSFWNKVLVGVCIIGVIILAIFGWGWYQESRMPADGRFNVVPMVQPEPEPDFPEPPPEVEWHVSPPTTTTTTLPNIEPPTPFETDKKTNKPWGCDEGEVRGVDC